ncbi:hypothetical protein C2S52_001933 [Perilla frutescens var. hirtella]|nr:hypothetical protein C2S52_001933 [Perilla frutescens var. hirtella]
MNRQERNDLESNGGIQLAASSESTPLAHGLPDSNASCDSQSMYKAAIEGDWKAAEILLNQDPSLAFRKEITEMGDRALHVAVYKKNTEFVRELIKWVNDPIELELLDGRGYKACCYAARAGIVEVAQLLTDKNEGLGSARNGHDTTPLQLAASYGNTDMILHFLRSAKIGDLYRKEWFDLLLVSVRSKMYDVALKILEKDGRLAVMTGEDDRTALHVLAQLDISSEMKPDLRLLAEKLWEEIQKLKKSRILKLIENPPILHDAAKVGNVQLITMITRSYRHLLWQRNDEGRSIYHTAALYRQDSMLELIKQAENIIDFTAISEDVHGNNILHLAGKLLPPDGLKIVQEPDVQMKKELAWFKAVEAVVPPFFVEKINKEGYKPREVFWKEHKSLIETSVKHMKSTSESCMLIATIILTVVFAAAFTPPGGYNQDTGIPILLRNHWFASFVIFEVLAMFSSTYAILTFWSIISLNYKEDQFLSSPNHLRHALTALLLSVMCGISVFLSAFFLVFVKERKALVVSFMVAVYVWLVVGVFFQLFKLFPKTNLLEYYSKMGARPSKYSPFNDSLWSHVHNFGASIWKFGASIVSYISSCFTKKSEATSMLPEVSQ